MISSAAPRTASGHLLLALRPGTKRAKSSTLWPGPVRSLASVGTKREGHKEDAQKGPTAGVSTLAQRRGCARAARARCTAAGPGSLAASVAYAVGAAARVNGTDSRIIVSVGQSRAHGTARNVWNRARVLVPRFSARCSRARRVVAVCAFAPVTRTPRIRSSTCRHRSAPQDHHQQRSSGSELAKSTSQEKRAGRGKRGERLRSHSPARVA